MTTRARGRVRNAALLMVLATASCKTDCNPTKQTNPGNDPVQLIGAGSNYVEISAAAAAPIGNGVCKDGMILVATGGSNKQLLMGSVLPPFPTAFDMAEWDGSTKWAKLGSGAIQPPATPTTDAPFGWDNQTARLANGDLLLMWNGRTTSLLTNTSELTWWDNPPGRNGFRPAQVFWRYSCSNGQWSATSSVLDSGTATVLDQAGTPRSRGYCAELKPGVGGFDRPELYVDPFTVDPNDAGKQRIYVSTDCKRSDTDRRVQIFASPDSGTTWEPSAIALDSGTPVAMTSTSNGRLLLFQALGETPTLYYSDDKGKSLATSMADDGSGEEKPSDRFDITFEYSEVPQGQPDPHAGEQKRFVVGALQSDVTGVGPPGVPTLSLARTGLNAAMAVYPAIETVTVDGKQIERQVAAVVWVLTKDKDHGPIVVPIKIIRAQEPVGSVLMATFIQDDSPNQKVGTSLLYWLETSSLPASTTDPVKMIARYIVFAGIIPSKEGVLSDAAGWELNNREPNHAVGDYMKGAFYSHAGALNFVAVWPQVPPTVASRDRSQVYMRVISFVPGSASGEPKVEALSGARPARRATLRRPAKPISVIPHDLRTLQLDQIRKP